MRRVVVTLSFALLLLSGCANESAQPPETAETSGTPEAESAFPFKEDVQGSITYVEYKPGMLMAVVPSGKSEQAPCVVILHGHTVETTFYHPLAKAVAESDAVVFIPEWDDTLPSDEDSRTATVTGGLNDIADAMRFVRQYAERYGGDPSRIVIAGHSLGATMAMTTMLAGDSFGTEAFPHEISAIPDAYVSLDGVVPFRELLWNEDLRRLYGQDPATWDKINPDTYLSEAGDRKGTKFRFFVADLDIAETKLMARRMKRLGYKTAVERIDVDHMQAGEPQTQTVEAIAQLAHLD